MMYRVNIISSISRNSAFPEVRGREPMPKLLFTDFQEFCSFRGGRGDRACTESI